MYKRKYKVFFIEYHDSIVFFQGDIRFEVYKTKETLKQLARIEQSNNYIFIDLLG